METLTIAPLIEVIFELRWGEVLKSSANKALEIHFTSHDKDLFPGKFHNLAESKGFTTFEEVNTGLPVAIPHTVTRRYRKSPNKWPCYQTGLGIFTVNQTNEGYKWGDFKQDALKGLEMLNKANSIDVDNFPAIGAELRYQDGFFLEEGETPHQFLKKKIALEFSTPSALLENEYLGPIIKGNSIEFYLDIMRPIGVLIFSLKQALINGQEGFVMETIVRSADKNTPKFGVVSLGEWLEDAHNIQKHVFRTMIDPRYMGQV